MFCKLRKAIIKSAATLTAVFLCLAGCTAKKTGDISKSESLTLPVAGVSQKPTADEISAKSAVVIELESGVCLWEKNPDAKMPMASTTKIMTALVALSYCDVDTVIKISPLAVGVEGSSVYLYAGEELTLEQLLYAMLLESANDAAAAIAIAVGGSIEGFADMMNKMAQALGLTDTHFENPHGLDGDSHYTTASELALITRAAMQNACFRKIVSTYKTTIPLNSTEGVRLLINHNKLLKSYEGAIGVKTGFTKKSGRCLVSAAECDGVEYICVTLNAPSDWSDHTRLLDFASSFYERCQLCEVSEYKYSLPLSDASEQYATFSNSEQLSVILPRNRGKITYTVEMPRFALGGVTQGQELGRIVFTLDGEIIAECPMRAEYTVMQKTKKFGFWRRIEALFA